MTSKSRITVLIPCHSTDYLSKSLQSIKDQTLDKVDFEVLLVADRINITEAGLILDKTGLTYRIIESIFPGIVPALNLGLDNIKSEYVARMDEDDVMLPDRLETQLRYLEENEKILAVGGQLILIDKNGGSKFVNLKMTAFKYPNPSFAKLSLGLRASNFL